MAGCVPHYIEGGVWSSCLCPSISAFLILPHTAGCARVFLGCCGILKIDSCYDAVNFDGLGNEILRRRNIISNESVKRHPLADWLISLGPRFNALVAVGLSMNRSRRSYERSG
jgi:hypothetical protein